MVFGVKAVIVKFSASKKRLETMAFSSDLDTIR
jgi:hypothetical protein